MAVKHVEMFHFVVASPLKILSTARQTVKICQKLNINISPWLWQWRTTKISCHLKMFKNFPFQQYFRWKWLTIVCMAVKFYLKFNKARPSWRWNCCITIVLSANAEMFHFVTAFALKILPPVCQTVKICKNLT